MSASVNGKSKSKRRSWQFMHACMHGRPFPGLSVKRKCEQK